MTPEQQIKALAELDGWTGATSACIPPYYLTSYDAIIPLIQKQESLYVRIKFQNNLREIVGRRMPINKAGQPLVSDVDLWSATPSQLAEALLRATGKWIE